MLKSDTGFYLFTVGFLKSKERLFLLLDLSIFNELVHDFGKILL